MTRFLILAELMLLDFFVAGAPALAKNDSLVSRIPAGIRSEPDLSYAANGNPRQRLDLYLPKSPKGLKPLPVVVFIHGGAFIWGDRKPEAGEGDPAGLNLMLSMVASGEYAGASIGYRLSNEAIWPAQIHDCKAAIRWLRGNAAKYKLDPNRIGVMGTSAGGHLSAMLGASAGVPAMEGELGKFLGVSSQVRCVVDEYGPTDFLALHGEHNRSPDTPAAKLIGGPVPDHLEAAQGASPMTYIGASTSPALLIHGTKDPVVNFTQSEMFYSALRKAGVDATLIPVTGGGHGNFSSPEVSERIRAFFDRHLRGKEIPVSAEPIRLEK